MTRTRSRCVRCWSLCSRCPRSGSSLETDTAERTPSPSSSSGPDRSRYFLLQASAQSLCRSTFVSDSSFFGASAKFDRTGTPNVGGVGQNRRLSTNRIRRLHTDGDLYRLRGRVSDNVACLTRINSTVFRRRAPDLQPRSSPLHHTRFHYQHNILA